MRVSEGMRFSHFLHQLDIAGRRLFRLQQQAATWRRVTRPSDDPVAASEAMRLRSRLAELDRYLANVGQASDWIAATESALFQAEDILSRARELAVAGASDALTPEAWDALAAEVDALIDALVQVGNTQLDGRYLFHGHQTTTVPFTRAGPGQPVNHVRDPGQIVRGIGPGVSVVVNVDSQVLQDAADALWDLYQGLVSRDTARISGTTLARLDAAADRLLVAHTTLGATAERLKREESRLLGMQVEAQSSLSAVEDVDVAQVVMNLRQAEVAYQATLAVGARLIQPTLIDFLR